MNGDDLRALLASGPLLSDGGMGTSLVDAGVAVGECFELLNDEQPHIVERVHRGFLDAGARLILTNTFGGSHFSLGRRGIAERVAELNDKGAAIARRVAGDALVAGSVGPLRVRLAPYGRVRPEEAFDAFVEQITALANGGVDIILIETQSDVAEIEQAVAAARAATDLAVAVTVTFTSDDRTLLGGTPEQIAQRLLDVGVDALGVNCGEGPAQALRVIRAMRHVVEDVPLIARPT